MLTLRLAWPHWIGGSQYPNTTSEHCTLDFMPDLEPNPSKSSKVPSPCVQKCVPQLGADVSAILCSLLLGITHRHPLWDQSPPSVVREVLKLNSLQCPGVFIKDRLLDPALRVSGSVGLGWALPRCISTRFSGKVEVAGRGNHSLRLAAPDQGCRAASSLGVVCRLEGTIYLEPHLNSGLIFCVQTNDFKAKRKEKNSMSFFFLKDKQSQVSNNRINYWQCLEAISTEDSSLTASPSAVWDGILQKLVRSLIDDYDYYLAGV